jgi:hypothetical protein
LKDILSALKNKSPLNQAEEDGGREHCHPCVDDPYQDLGELMLGQGMPV